MSRHHDDLFKQALTDGLKKQHSAGLAQGAYAMCKVIFEKATDESKTIEQRLADVVTFCKNCVVPIESDKS